MRDYKINENREFRGVWIPAELYLNKELSLNEKFLLLEAASLEKNGKCYADNRHFAEFLGLSIIAVKKIVQKLREKGYIETEIEYVENTKQVKCRYIHVFDRLSYRTKFEIQTENQENDSSNESDDSSDDEQENSDNEGGIKNYTRGGIEKYTRGGIKKYTHKNTYINNTSLNNTCLNNNIYNNLNNNSQFEERNNSTYMVGRCVSDRATVIDCVKNALIRQGHTGNFSDDVNHVIDAIGEFYEEYYNRFEKAHPILADITYVKAIKSLLNAYYDIMLECNRVVNDTDLRLAMSDYIYHYFDMEYEKDGYDCRLPHFANWNVIKTVCQRNFGYGFDEENY